MLYLIRNPKDGTWLQGEVMTPSGKRVVYWTLTEDRARAYKRLSAAHTAAIRTGGEVIPREEDTNARHY